MGRVISYDEYVAAVPLSRLLSPGHACPISSGGPASPPTGALTVRSRVNTVLIRATIHLRDRWPQFHRHEE